MKRVLIAVCLLIYLAFIPVKNSGVVFAEDEMLISESEIKTELTNYLQVGETNRTRLNRTAGTSGEHASATYLASRLNEMGLTLKNNDGFSSGLMKFEYENSNGEFVYSYNVSAVISSAATNAKTIVLAASYDSLPLTKYDNETKEEKLINGEMVNADSGAVSLVLTMTNKLKSLSLNYNVEVVFFGASYQNNEGVARYLMANANSNREISFVLNVSNTTLGNYNYCYSEGFKTSYLNYINRTLISRNNKFREFSPLNNSYYDGYGVANAGSSGVVNLFLKKGINACNIFSGDYQGLSSMDKVDNLTATEKDTIVGIEEATGANVAQNLNIVGNALLNLLQDDGFIINVSNKNDVSQTLRFFEDYRFVLIGLLIICLIAYIVYKLLYFRFLHKAYKEVGNGMVKLNITGVDEDDAKNIKRE
ncbi:MAG: hypothetical protein J5689_02240 [Clostridia bacterium]|nr:hypothetical protein [Clostridia bacterium]